jgi:hypothetical protein
MRRVIMRQLAIFAILLSLGPTGCMRPPNKQTGYALNGAAVVGGGLFLAIGLTRDCENTSGSGIGCSTSSGLSTAMGALLLAVGGIGIGITAASDIPDKP